MIGAKSPFHNIIQSCVKNIDGGFRSCTQLEKGGGVNHIILILLRFVSNYNIMYLVNNLYYDNYIMYTRKCVRCVMCIQ